MFPLHGGLSRPLIKVKKHTPDALRADGTFPVNTGVLSFMKVLLSVGTLQYSDTEFSVSSLL